jgi:hypothetical protein
LDFAGSFFDDRGMQRVPTSAALIVALAACGSSHPVVHTPPAGGSDAAANPVERAVDRPVAPARPLATLAGDDKIDERWRTPFRTWLTAAGETSYVEVIDTQIVSNSAAIVLRRHTEQGGECREGPSTLTIIQDEGAEPSYEVTDFGDDCCAGTECKRTEQSWNLRYLKTVEAKDWPGLAKLAPARGKLVLHATWATDDGKGGEQTRRLTRKEIAAGKLTDPPGCGFINTTPTCEPRDARGKGFTCACNGGGYHVTYRWQKEGAGFVLARIDEDSH